MALRLPVAVLSLCTGLLLVAATLPLETPQGFVALLRWSVTATGILLAVHALTLRNYRMATALALIAIVYNPFLGAGEGSAIWQLINLFAAAPFLIYPLVLPRPRRAQVRLRSAAGAKGKENEKAALAPPAEPGRSASSDEVAASAREMYERYGPKALELARNRQRQLMETGRTRMAEEWRKLVAALEPLVAAGAPDAAPAPVDLEFEEIDPRRPGVPAGDH
ncbi:MAG: DUF6804 family protein [Acetobacterales bacterium]